ncbi:MAG TPA: aldose epimerase family protein, partial [Rhizomicrobium sp.]|nr:aldose epimerase family protein [Rhizomicrobium sp.]
LLGATCLLVIGSASAQAAITMQPWGKTGDDGRPANLYTLTNAKGMSAEITNYGGVIVSIKAPGRGGAFANVVQGFDTLADYTSEDYIRANGHYGSIIGRFANRIKGAKVTVDGKSYALDPDKNGDLDQGGVMAYFRQVFTPAMHDGAEPQLILKRADPDGYMGFPGTVQVTVTYTLTRNNTLRIDMRATTDKKTVINLINHSYFSLSADPSKVIDGETLQLFAHHYTPIDSGSIPTGEIGDVAGTDFDFTNPTALGPRLASADPQIAAKKGIDHNFVIDGTPGELRIAARLRDAQAGRQLEVWTTQPGVQVYSENSVRPQVAHAKGYVPHSAISFQTQHYPDSPNHPNFPSTELAPGKVFHEVTEFRFSAIGQ